MTLVTFPNRPHRPPPDPIAACIAQHGARRVFLAALRALVRPRLRKARQRPLPLNAHLRRDIGLPPQPRDITVYHLF